jgi:hypothetical protein
MQPKSAPPPVRRSWPREITGRRQSLLAPSAFFDVMSAMEAAIPAEPAFLDAMQSEALPSGAIELA